MSNEYLIDLMEQTEIAIKRSERTNIEILQHVDTLVSRIETRLDHAKVLGGNQITRHDLEKLQDALLEEIASSRKKASTDTNRLEYALESSRKPTERVFVELPPNPISIFGWLSTGLIFGSMGTFYFTQSINPFNLFSAAVVTGLICIWLLNRSFR